MCTPIAKDHSLAAKGGEWVSYQLPIHFNTFHSQWYIILHHHGMAYKYSVECACIKCNTNTDQNAGMTPKWHTAPCSCQLRDAAHSPVTAAGRLQSTAC